MPVVPCGYFFFESKVCLVYGFVNTTLPFSLRTKTFSGSSELSIGGSIPVGSSSVGGEHDAEPVVVEVSEAMGQPSDFLDDQVDGFGAAVGDP